MNKFAIFDLTSTIAPVPLWTGGILLAGVAVYWTFWLLQELHYEGIPAIGPTGPISSYKYALRRLNEAREMLEEGAKKYPIFRIPLVEHWLVVVTGEKYVEELRRAPDEILSFEAAVEDLLQGKYLFGQSGVGESQPHIAVVKSNLTRNLPTLFSGLRDEIALAFDEYIPPTQDWSRVHAYGAMTQIIAQASNRIFVGVPLCRNQEYKTLNITFTRTISTAREKLIRAPRVFRPLVARWFTHAPQSINEGLKFLGPVIAEREKLLQEYGKNYPDKPNDFLSWLMDEAKGHERDPRMLTNRILQINFAAIHTSSGSFTHALYELASDPECVPALFEEINACVEKYGWTKMALVHMYKLDSLFKESQRYNGISFVSMTRLALKDFTLSNGTRIRKGTFICAANTHAHFDDKTYEDPYRFDPFRFAAIREEEGYGTTNQFVATNPNYIAFGHGKHACPGRFFAANELKAMMAHLILNYEVKLEDGAKPRAHRAGLGVMPNMESYLLFRRRQV